MRNRIRIYIDQNFSILLSLAVSLISISAFIYYAQSGSQLIYADSLFRLNISRKIIDNITPNLAQIGNVWLPLPQLLMLPFVWNNYLWHSGIAAYVMSGTSFVLGGVFLFKSAFIITKNKTASFISLLIYLLNINLLYLQTTAMSESIFLCSIIFTIFFFLRWIETNRYTYVILSALSVACMTLIRYEGLAVLFSSIPILFFFTYVKSRSFIKSEGNTILYLTLACVGFAFWTLYLTAIFNDPFYWKNFYVGTPRIIDGTQAAVHITTPKLSILEASWKYIIAVIWMNGLIPFTLSIFAIPALIYNTIKNRTWYFVPIVMSLSIFAFMVLTLQRNTPIQQPNLTIDSILSSNTSRLPEFNVRYGLLMLPIISLLCSYLLAFKNRGLHLIIVLMLFFQIYTYFNPFVSFIYQIPLSIKGTKTQGLQKERDMVTWLKENYDGGLIMISALKHDPQMFQLGLPYRTFIHEGTDNYWKVSVNNPTIYAKWVIYDSTNQDDQVKKYLLDSPIVNKEYKLVFETDGMRVYKKNTAPLKTI